MFLLKVHQKIFGLGVYIQEITKTLIPSEMEKKDVKTSIITLLYSHRL